jgi:hypothetical protein
VHLSEGRVLAAWFGGTFEGLEDTAIYTALRFSPGNWSVPRVAAKVWIEPSDTLHGHMLTPSALCPSDALVRFHNGRRHGRAGGECALQGSKGTPCGDRCCCSAHLGATQSLRRIRAMG